jgi:hypothetical protein
MPKKPLPDDPDLLAQKAAKMPWKDTARVDVLRYERVILELHKRGYSFAEMAAWLTKEIGAPVKRGQVYYAYQQSTARQLQELKDAESRGELEVTSYPSPKRSAAEAEKKAKAEDEKTP